MKGKISVEMLKDFELLFSSVYEESPREKTIFLLFPWNIKTDDKKVSSAINDTFSPFHLSSKVTHI